MSGSLPAASRNGEPPKMKPAGGGVNPRPAGVNPVPARPGEYSQKGGGWSAGAQQPQALRMALAVPMICAACSLVSFLPASASA